jgi:hypothetical protein
MVGDGEKQRVANLDRAQPLIHFSCRKVLGQEFELRMLISVLVSPIHSSICGKLRGTLLQLNQPRPIFFGGHYTQLLL